MNSSSGRRYVQRFSVSLAFLNNVLFQVKLWKSLIGTLAGVIFGIQAYTLVFSVLQDDRSAVPVYALQTAFALYILSLSAYATFQTGSQHARLVVHLTALTFLATALLSLTILFPSTAFPVEVSSLAQITLLRALQLAVPALYFVIFLVAGSIPRGPPLHFPSERLYSIMGSMRMTSEEEHNVTAEISTSLMLSPA